MVIQIMATVAVAAMMFGHATCKASKVSHRVLPLYGLTVGVGAGVVVATVALSCCPYLRHEYRRFVAMSEDIAPTGTSSRVPSWRRRDLR